MEQKLNDKSIDIINFIAGEEKNLLISMANDHEEKQVIGYIQGLLDAVMDRKLELPENDMIIIQMLFYVQHHFLTATTTFMRGHLSEAYGSARMAIDAAFVATRIIDDRSSQLLYLNDDDSFVKPIRYFKNKIKKSEPLTHPYIPELIEMHQKFSTFTSHAAVGSFFHRVKIDREKPQLMLFLKHYQIPENPIERKVLFLSLLQSFLVILEVFSPYVVDEEKMVQQAWVDQIRQLGTELHTRIEDLSAELPEDVEFESHGIKSTDA